jgi:hypothetical protein
MDIPMDDTLSDMNQEIGNEEQLSDTEGLPTGMEEEMPMDSMENDKTMEIINKLSDKDKKTVEAYAESLLSNDEDKNDESEDEQIPDGLNMEQPVNESFIFTKKQLTKLMENFGPTNDELEKDKKEVESKMNKNSSKNTPFNSPKFK